MTISKCQFKQAIEIWQKHTDDEIDASQCLDTTTTRVTDTSSPSGTELNMWGQEFADWAEAEIVPHRPDLSMVTLPITIKKPHLYRQEGDGSRHRCGLPERRNIGNLQRV